MYRGVINGKAGKAAALPKFSDRGTDYAHPLALPCLKKLVIIPLRYSKNLALVHEKT